MYSVLSDINKDLINTYKAIRDDWQAVWVKLQKHRIRHSPLYYYHVRGEEPRNSVDRAARFVYLNRTCWNGLYRVNKAGAFNVPIGTRTSVVLPTDDFAALAKVLNKSRIKTADFETVIDEAQKGDLIYADPPYTVLHDNNGFIKYNDQLFSWQDQKRLQGALLRATGRGVQVVSTNAAHSSIEELYSSNFHIYRLSRRSLMAADNTYRKVTKELLITSFKVV